MVTSRRLQRTIIFGATLILGGIGWFIGLYATAQPALTTGDGHITLWSVETPVPVDLDVVVLPSGRVHVSAFANSEDKNAAYVLVLTNDARFVDLQSDRNLDHLRVQTFNTRGDQLIQLSFEPGSGFIQFSATPIQPWISQTLGNRIATTPTVEFGIKGGEPVSLISLANEAEAALGLKRDSLNQPSLSSRLGVVLTSSDSEELESFFPSEGTQIINGGYPGEPGTNQAVHWHLDRAKSERLNFMLPVNGRYSNRQGQADSQRLLLLSGVLLGVAASMLLEVLLAWSKGRGESGNGAPVSGGAA